MKLDPAMVQIILVAVAVQVVQVVMLQHLMDQVVRVVQVYHQSFLAHQRFMLAVVEVLLIIELEIQ
jgi:hypothetical protein